MSEVMKHPVDWEFSDENDGPKVYNLPTDEGRELGYHLSRLTDAGADTWPSAPERCDDCAFRFNTDPNGCVATLMDALKSIAEEVPFGCHRREGLCAGYVIARHAWAERV